jgi:glycosyltransferase involved in cell wall biosynthesis
VQHAWTAAKNAGEGREYKQFFKHLEIQKVTVSACIIARNNESIINRCIDSIKDAVDEIVFVDTGSMDNTVQIVESLGIKVHYYKCIDDFAAARNYAQSLATSDWVITVDTDDVLYLEDKDVTRTEASCYDL